MSVGDLVVKRLEATRKLQENPNDFTAQQTLAYIEQKVIQSNVDYFHPALQETCYSTKCIWIDDYIHLNKK